MLVTLSQLKTIIAEGIMLDEAGVLDEYEINLNESSETISLEDYVEGYVESMGEFPAMPGMEEQSAREIAQAAAEGYVDIDPEHRTKEDIEKIILNILIPNGGLHEAEYRGRKVTLGKPMKGDVKKYKVYVKDKKTGNVKKVNFGDPNMQIRRDNPKARKSFRARHGCGTNRASDRTKAAYWSCRLWSRKPVSKILRGK